ncbi:YraN family protein [Enterovibrio sp. 27052020O]|uniref:YraN family protein n=1 Tax=Enterovibrio sp. 27052020O TaxID=3241166 RepID=UPI00388D3E32
MFPLNKKQTGDHYEQQACRFLERQGLTLLDKNARFKVGELDLVMRQGSCIVFVEVKFRKQSGFGGASATISHQKQRRLLKSAYLWLAKQGLSATHTEFRFDAVAFEGGINAVNWMKNIFIEG